MNATTSYVRAIRGPVLLITLGTLLAVDHGGGASFWRTWPALLVILGILILAERLAVTPAGPPPFPRE